jgi:O-antigen ligase
MSAEGHVSARESIVTAPAKAAAVLGATGAIALLAAAVGAALYRYPPSNAIVLATGIGLLGTLALALARYRAAVVLGFLIFGVVQVEPAPTDAVFAIVIAVALAAGRFELRRVPLVITSLLAIFAALNLLSGMEVVDPTRAARFFAITIYLVVFALWLTSYVRTQDHARTVVLAYIVGAAATAAAAVVALVVAFPGSDNFTYAAYRARGLFKDPNVFGPFLIPAALILAEEILTPRLFGARRLLKAALFGVVALGIFFSYSRAAWLNFSVAVLVMLLVLLIRRGGSRRALLFLSTIFAMAAIVVPAVALTGSIQFLEERARFQEYDVRRFEAQNEGIAIAEEHLFGIGPGQFEPVVQLAAHSTYIRALTEYGVLGLATVLALMLATLIFASRNVLLGRDTYGIGSAALLAAWCGILANSAFVDTGHWRHLWFVAALIWAGAMRSRRDFDDAELSPS